jgi:uncharacterized protein (DUF433 family)
MKWTRSSRLQFGRITIDPVRMNGTPSIRDLPIAVATIVSMANEGMSAAQILSAYPELEREDIEAALRYSAAKKSAEANFIEPMRNRIRNLGLPEDDA